MYGYLLALCASGRVSAILGGPPCRTVSALRYQNDDGPGVLRTDAYPYGLPTLTPADHELVMGDSILMFRFWSLLIMAEEVRPEEAPETQFFMEQPEDPARYRSSELLSEAMMKKAAIEEELQQFENKEEDQTQAIAKEFLVTKTVSDKEVWQNAQDWEPSVRAEFEQLVNQKKAVRQMSRRELQALAAEKALPIEMLPAKIVFTRKENSGAYRSRAVVCGNYPVQKTGMRSGWVPNQSDD